MKRTTQQFLRRLLAPAAATLRERAPLERVRSARAIPGPDYEETAPAVLFEEPRDEARDAAASREPATLDGA